jgi:hypothetical protein
MRWIAACWVPVAPSEVLLVPEQPVPIAQPEITTAANSVRLLIKNLLKNITERRSRHDQSVHGNP